MSLEGLAFSMMEDARKNDGIAALEAEVAVQFKLHKAKNERIQHLEARLDAARMLLGGSRDMMSAWGNGVCPEGVSLDEDCPKCNVKCNVYVELDSELQQWLAESDDG